MSEVVQQLRQNLKQIKKASSKTIQENFYQFMLKAKDKIGESVYHMAQFYYEYGNFILEKQQSNLDLFNEQQQEQDEKQSEKEEQQKVKEREGQQQESDINLNILQTIIKLHIDEVKNKQKQEQQPKKEEIEKQQQEGQADQQSVESIYDDRDICALNLQMAIQIYEGQLAKNNNGESNINKDQVLDGLRKTRTRLGDLYLNDQDYIKSVEHYEKVIELQSTRQGFQCNRFISQLYYLIGNAYLYTNEQEYEGQAISQFIKAVNTLLNYLKIKLNYDISTFDIPTIQKTKVQRIHYLPVLGDIDQIIELKDIISCLLNKIEEGDTDRELRKSYEKQRRKSLEKEQQKKMTSSKQASINLRSFGNLNRKKKICQQDVNLNLRDDTPPKLYFTQKKQRKQKQEITKKHSE